MLAATVVAAATAAAALTQGYVDANAAVMWGAFKRDYGRRYASAEEDARRLRVFTANMRAAADQQSQDPTAEYGVTQFADMTPEEFSPYHSGYRRPAAGNRTSPPDIFSADEVAQALVGSVDWRKSGAVTAVKDQQKCGSCWSFSTAANVEGQWFLAGHELVPLSEQQLVSCDKTDDGCGGGLPENAFRYLLQHGGVHYTEASYPYKDCCRGDSPGSSFPCKTGMRGATITGQTSIPHNEGQMAAYVQQHGPISVGVNAQTWQSYRGGIMQACAAAQMDHAVTVVGYGSAVGRDYWLIKNSWNTGFGESGYIRIGRGSNTCNIRSDPTSSTVRHVRTPPPPPPLTPPPAPPPPQLYACQVNVCVLSAAGRVSREQCAQACGGTPPAPVAVYACAQGPNGRTCIESSAGKVDKATCEKACGPSTPALRH